MPVSSTARQAGAEPEEKARGFKDRAKELQDALKTLAGIQAQLAASSKDTTHTGKTARIFMEGIAADLAAKLSQIQIALREVVDAHLNEVTPPDRGGSATIAKTLAAGALEGQFDVTLAVSVGVAETAPQISQFVQQQLGEKQVAYLPERIGMNPDPNIPSQGLKPTIEQAWTHAAHEAARANNAAILAEIWGVFDFSVETFQTFIMETFQVAGYYAPPGPRRKLDPKPEVFKLLATPEYIPYLTDEQINTLLVGMAGHQSTRAVSEELGILMTGLAQLPPERREKIDYVGALNAAISHPVKQPSHIRAMLPHLDQQVIDDGYAVVASKQNTLMQTEDRTLIEAADLLLEKATKPLSPDTLMAIAKTGYKTNLDHALADANNVGIADLPEVMASVTTPPFVGAEDKVISVLGKIKAYSTRLAPEQWQAVLDHAVINGQENLLRELTSVPDVRKLFNGLDERHNHENYQGNKILYMAATYTGKVRAETDTKGKAEDVAKALRMTGILMRYGADPIMGESNVTVSSVLTERVEKDNKGLAKNETLQLIQERFQTELLARRERALARARKETELDVLQERGLLHGSGQGERLAIERPIPSAPALPPSVRRDGPVIEVDPPEQERPKG